MPSRQLSLLLLLLLSPHPAAQTRRLDVLGQEPEERLGSSVALLGDLDGDGWAEWAVARGGPLGHRPELFVHSGRDGRRLHTLPGAGSISALYRQSILDLGDVDGDGIGDVAFGNSGARAGGQANVGRVTVFSGASGQRLYFTAGPVSFGAFGASLARLGDLDADGVDDLVVGQIGTMDENAWVLSGVDGALLLGVRGPNGNDPEFGWSVAATGDLDGDGLPDFAVGTLRAGIVRCVSGATGTLVRTLRGGRTFGRQLADLGDVDGDGYRDLLVSESAPGVVQLFSGADGRLLARYDEAGAGGLSALGDADGDGRADFLVGDPAAHEARGEVHLVSSWSGKRLARFLGQQAGERLGSSLAGGDAPGRGGLAELVLGAPAAGDARRAAALGRATLWALEAPRRRLTAPRESTGSPARRR